MRPPRRIRLSARLRRGAILAVALVLTSCGSTDSASQGTSPTVDSASRPRCPAPLPAHEVLTVRKGQTLCILEAMKLMNELDAEVDGVVREILAENADPVEYGQVLFRIEPGGSA